MISPPRAGHVLVLVAAVEAGLVLLALVLGPVVGVDPLAVVRLDAMSLAVGLGGALAGVVLLGWGVISDWPPVARLRAVVLREVAPLFQSASTVQLLLIAVLAGVGEEIFFRAFLQTALDRVAPAGIALALVSVLFGALHAITPTYGVAATLLGLSLGALLLATGNVLGPIVAHAGYDFVALLLLRRLVSQRRPPLPGPAE